MINYVRMDHERAQHHNRYLKHVEAHGLTCQECGGEGGEIEDILHFDMGPWVSCGFCEGTGLVTRHMRGQWLRWKKEDKRRRDEHCNTND